MAARRMFDRVLATWAMDVLALKRRGLDRPCYRGAGVLQRDDHAEPEWDHAAY